MKNFDTCVLKPPGYERILFQPSKFRKYQNSRIYFLNFDVFVVHHVDLVAEIDLIIDR